MTYTIEIKTHDQRFRYPTCYCQMNTLHAPTTANRHQTRRPRKRKILGIMVPPRTRKFANLIQEILLSALARDEYQSSVRRHLPCSNKVSISIVRIALVVEPAAHGSCNNAPCYCPYVAEGEVVFEGFLVVGVHKRDGYCFVRVAVAHS